ncbi:unnamed protein product [Trichobilharzia szidati]|nr:unnamed protein product [Trichobilharzia szidati]
MDRLLIMKFPIILLIIFKLSLSLGSIPKIKNYSGHGGLCKIDELLSFENDYPSCYILEEAMRRFLLRLRMKHIPTAYPLKEKCLISRISVNISEGCNEEESKLWPSASMNESYSLEIDNGTINIYSEEIWGTLHAFETILQMVYRGEHGQNQIFECRVKDSPRFAHRGVLIDTARHYLSIETIKNVTTAMSIVKMNVLHWHMTDDESFPYSSSIYPELSSKGAYHPQEYVYERGEIDALIEFARLRGIRVIVEFDTPGHTLSWGKGHSEILTGEEHEGPINPTSENILTFLSSLFQEILSVFHDEYLHLGGSAFDKHWWQEDEAIQEFMQQQGFDQDYNKLESYYFQQLTEIIQNIASDAQKTISPVVWDSVFVNGFRGDLNTIIQVLNNDDWKSVVESITSAGYKVINSACWSENHGDFSDYGEKAYYCQPSDFGGTDEEVELVIGGEVVIWGTYVDDINLLLELWPVITVAAERLWADHANDFQFFLTKLKMLYCQIKVLGWKLKPFIGPGFCAP